MLAGGREVHANTPGGTCGTGGPASRAKPVAWQAQYRRDVEGRCTACQCFHFVDRASSDAEGSPRSMVGVFFDDRGVEINWNINFVRRAVFERARQMFHRVTSARQMFLILRCGLVPARRFDQHFARLKVSVPPQF